MLATMEQSETLVEKNSAIDNASDMLPDIDNMNRSSRHSSHEDPYPCVKEVGDPRVDHYGSLS